MIKIWLRVATDDSFAHFWNGTMTRLQFKATISIKRLLTLKVCALKLQTDNITAIKLCFWHYLGRTNETEGNFSIYLLKCGGGRTAVEKRPATQFSASSGGRLHVLSGFLLRLIITGTVSFGVAEVFLLWDNGPVCFREICISSTRPRFASRWDLGVFFSHLFFKIHFHLFV